MDMQSNTYREDLGWSTSFPTGWDGPATLVLAFGARHYDAESQVFEDLRTAFPSSVLVGCSTAGEIQDSLVDDDSVGVVVTRFDHSRLVLAVTHSQGADDSGAAGERLASQLPHEGLRAVFVLTHGLAVNGTPLVAALSQGLPAGVPITGGLAGDGDRFDSTWVMVAGQTSPNRMCAIGFYGERLQVGSGCDGGWIDFGPVRRITRSQGNVLHELDGRPALDLYKEYLGRLSSGLPRTALLFPLSIRSPGEADKPVVRSILNVDEQQHSMTFAGDVPQGHEARLMRTSYEDLISSAGQAMAQACAGLSGKEPLLVISVSCLGRRLVLGERTEEEVEAVMSGARAGSSHIGFYSYGEISPHPAGGFCALHNQSITVTVLSEA